MKCAVLADIHSNLAALEAVLADIDQKGGAEEFWCLGDIVGYGPDPHRCIELIQNRCSICVAGNHDWAATGKMDIDSFNPEAAEAAEWTARHLESEDIRFLESLPLTLENRDFTLAHGSPRNPIWEYVLSVADAEENLKYFKTPYCLVGHSHIPVRFECDESCCAFELALETPINLGKNRLILNPGSVGQPRDGDPRAGYAVYNSDTRTVTHHRIRYDILNTQQRMRDAGLPDWLVYRLALGK